MNLEELSNKYEKGLELKYQIPSTSQILKVLYDKRKRNWHLHRYFTLGSRWQISLDAQGVNLDTVWKWLADPKAVVKE